MTVCVAASQSLPKFRCGSPCRTIRLFSARADPMPYTMEPITAQPIEEFMQSYFAERAELHRAHRVVWDDFIENIFTADYLAALRESMRDDWSYEKQNPAVVLGIKVKARRRLAVVTTSEPEGCEQVHYRYYLLATEAGWRIDRKGMKCLYCDGTGYRELLLAMGQVGGTGGCPTCRGLGWRYDRSGPV